MTCLPAGRDPVDALSDAEALAIVDTRGSERRQRGQPPNPSDIGAVLDVVCVADVPPERVTWLWPRRIPLAKLTVIEGHPGLGKSSFAADLAARVTRDGIMPDGVTGVRGPVVLLNAEDGLGDTTRPRLQEAGADLTQVHAVRGIVLDGRYDELTLPEHVVTLAAEIDRLGAVLIIVDPLTAFLSSAVNTWRDHDVRRALRPLAALAEQCRAAVLCVRHLTKATGKQAITAGNGSIGIIAAARAGYLVAVDPDDKGARLLLSVKNNLAPMAPALRFRLEDAGAVARVAWLGQAEQTADGVLAAEAGDADDREATSECAQWLRDLLTGDKQLDRRDVLTAGKTAGFKERTVERAARSLRVRKHQSGFGRDRRSGWSLPIPDSVSDTAGKAEMAGMTEMEEGQSRHSRHIIVNPAITAVKGEGVGNGGPGPGGASEARGDAWEPEEATPPVSFPD